MGLWKYGLQRKANDGDVMPKTYDKPNDFGKLYEACKEAKLDCQLFMYGSGKKAGLQIEVYKQDDKDGSPVDKEQVKPNEKPETAAKRMMARMKKDGKFG